MRVTDAGVDDVRGDARAGVRVRERGREWERPLVDAATVVAVGALAGEERQASWLELPAATATNTPFVVIFATASLIACEKPPPRDMLATAGRAVVPAT